MLLVLFVILALAIYGGYSAMAVLFPSEAGPATPAEAGGGLIAAIKPYAVDAASSGLNIKMEELPAQGCSESLLSPQKVYELTMTLPEPHRSMLAQTLSAGSTVWTAQLYKDENRVGLCLPSQRKLITFPVTEQASALTTIFNSMQTLLPKNP